MQKVMLIGATLVGAVLFAATPVSIKWSTTTVGNSQHSGC